MTNKEKYIDNAKIRQLAFMLSHVCYVDNKTKTLSQKFVGVDGIKRASDIEKWLLQEVELSADEMFADLGYKRITGNAEPVITYEYKRKGEDNIFIHITERYFYKKCDKYSIAMSITEDEDRAIHKKIEELKNESKKVVR